MSSGGIAFAPNVTPTTFNDPPPPIANDDDGPESMLFPAHDEDALQPRKTSRKKPDNYIPRPPNAFILFRSAFIRSQHVSTGVETNHSTLSKIIGMTWQNLPNEERQVWHRKAKLAEEQHRLKFPQYAFKPLHSKKKGGKRKVREVGPKDQTRCAKIAELLVQGKKGKELDEAVKEFDKHHVPTIVTRFEAPITEQSFRRSSSEPASVKEEEGAPAGLSTKPRAASSSQVSCRSASSAPSCPSPLSTEILSLPVPLQTQGVSEQDTYLGVPSFDQYGFEPTPSEHTFDFNSFTFNSNIHSSDTLYQFDSQPQPLTIHPLDNTFVQPSSSTPSNQLIPPHLSIDTSLSVDMKSWSRCNSPASPSTNTNSMPTTPAYAGTPPPPSGRYRVRNTSTPEYTYQHKSSYNTATRYHPYQGLASTYDSAQVPIMEPHCDYTRTQLPPHGSEVQHVDLDYSSFMASMNPYSL
ncbi:hypothetical protein CC1G_11980 [Coprinopsis cinerea okayama7|uniref:HMG box domain-containing protein n=1 Tax=Coprinopsis cinerea (strain Okayama-7 / 130 / ATCC MYA-4618 / FGSC 9003) TaxID=240176 RepID=A8P0P1_COPC7|nr:hypothetical protein CC1G_11980 [Coprinopsis cinerea okayama7\|eukprot:XP_001837936.2 hypothetical protein CC1G_11980 [Coprinopsis cinerea okayama7\